MKIAATWTASILIALTGGVWFGYQRNNPPITWGFQVSETCGGGHYSTETFLKINEEIGPKIDALIGENVGQNLFIAVIPSISGFRVRAAGNSNSKLFKEPTTNQLADWIMWRMDELRYEESKTAEQAGTGQPATRPESKFESSDKPQPESEGRFR